MLWPHLRTKENQLNTLEFTERLRLAEGAALWSESERVLLDVTSQPPSFPRCEAHYSLRDVVRCPQAYNWGKEVQVRKSVSSLRMFDLLCCCVAARRSSSGVMNSLDLVLLWTTEGFLTDKTFDATQYENGVVQYLLLSTWRYLKHEGEGWWYLMCHMQSECVMCTDCLRGSLKL